MGKLVIVVWPVLPSAVSLLLRSLLLLIPPTPQFSRSIVLTPSDLPHCSHAPQFAHTPVCPLLPVPCSCSEWCFLLTGTCLKQGHPSYSHCIQWLFVHSGASQEMQGLGCSLLGEIRICVLVTSFLCRDHWAPRIVQGGQSWTLHKRRGIDLGPANWM